MVYCHADQQFVLKEHSARKKAFCLMVQLKVGCSSGSILVASKTLRGCNQKQQQLPFEHKHQCLIIEYFLAGLPRGYTTTRQTICVTFVW